MANVTLKPTGPDVALANAIAANTGPAPERMTGILTWGADEHILLALASAGFLYAHVKRPALRPAANHILLVTVVMAMLPHALKSHVDQTRPDRRTVRGHWRGIPFSGKSRDAFPSGHAVHMGALASVASVLPPKPRAAVRAIAIGLSLTRIVLLAHWASDVLAGFALGALTERALRRVTGYSDAAFSDLTCQRERV